MKRALFVVALAVFSWLVFGAHDASWARQESIPRKIDRAAMANQLQLMGVGSELRVYLTDGSKLDGTLREVQDDGFVVASKEGGKTKTVLLTQVQRLQTTGGGHRKITYILIGTAAVIGALFVIAVATC
jgi:hypothetical protein